MANIQEQDIRTEATRRIKGGEGFGDGIRRIERWTTEDLHTLQERLRTEVQAAELALEGVAQVLATREVLATD